MSADGCIISIEKVTLIRDQKKYDGTLKLYTDHYLLSGIEEQTGSYDICNLRVLKRPDLHYSRGKFGSAATIGVHLMASESQYVELIMFDDSIKDLIRAIDTAAADEKQKRSQNQKKRQYNAAVSAFENAATSAKMLEAASMFRELNGYMDADTYVQKCEQHYETLREDEYKSAYELYSVMNSVEEASKAITAFRLLGDYKDSREMVAKCSAMKDKIEQLMMEDRKKAEKELVEHRKQEEERKRLEAEEEERRRLEMEEQKRKEAEEAEHIRQEEERKRLEAQEVERRRLEMEEQKRKEDEEAESRRQKEEERRRLETEEQKRLEERCEEAGSTDESADQHTEKDYRCMQDKVIEFINKQDRKKADIEYKYRSLITQYADLYSDETVKTEISYRQYRKTPGAIKEKGKYYLVRKIPLELTDEEFAAVEASIPQEKLNSFRLQAAGVRVKKNDEGTSTAATFFAFLAWIFWIGGLIIAVSSSSVEVPYRYTTETQFSFSLFITNFLIYFISGCLAACASELFSKLQTIINLLNRKPDR